MDRDIEPYKALIMEGGWIMGLLLWGGGGVGGG